MTNLSTLTFPGQINNFPVELINARDVHQLLQVKTRFDIWINRRLSETRFRKNLDFIERSSLNNRGFFKTETKEYHLTLRMAEHLCLMENNEIGDRIRDLFIAREEQARCEIPQLKAENAKLQEKLTALLPPNAVNVSKDRYIELLESENRLLRHSATSKPKRAANVPLSVSEKQQILQLGQNGLTIRQIALQVNRSLSAVRAVIREA